MKKILCYLLSLSLIFSSIPVNVLAQESSSVSSDVSLDSPPVSSSSSVTSLPDINVFDNLNSQDIPLSGLTNSTNSQTSATFSLPVKVHKLSKRNFRGDEKITIIVENASIDNVAVQLFDVDGNNVSVEMEKVSAEDPAVLRLIPPKQFKAGRYRLVITDSSGNITTQDFTWGVLAINTNKSIYTPNETANIAMAVLDETGLMICDASVELRITNQELGVNDTLSTSNGKIIVNPDCSVKDYTLKPDYEANYQVLNAGFYDMTLTAKTNNGTYSITDGFDVRDSVAFDVERVNATRIFPPVTYSSIFNITANEDFTGTITETVPDSFAILPTDGAKFADNISSESAQVSSEDLIKGEIPNLNLPYQGSFAISQKFGSEIRDPLVAAKYSQFGLAGHDGIDFDLPEGEAVLAADDGEVVRATENGDYGTTIVIQHSWGKSYYGHLSLMTAYVGKKVQKGWPIGMSGSTGLSSGPHLHFGIKPNKNDFNNGYYGKINPLPYLGLESFQSGGENIVFSSNQAQSYDVRVLSWNVSLKKGDKIKLGYGYKVPNVSPQFYLLGPMQFTDNNGEITFQEQRQWQLAIDATLSTLIPGAGTTPNAGDADTATSNAVVNEGNTACNAADCSASVDETIALTDDGTTFLNNLNNNTATRVQGFELTDMPSDFSSMDTLTIDVRVQRTGTRTNDDIVLLAQVFEDGGTTALTNQVTICTWNGTTNDCGTPWNTITKTFTLQGNNTKTVYDSAELHLTWSTTKSAAADGTEVQASTAELDGTYTIQSGPTNDQLMRHGKWFNAGAEQPFTF